MKASEVVSSLQARGVKLWQEAGALRYRAPAGALTDREKAALKAHKAAILRALVTSTPPVPGEPSAPCTTCGSNHFWLSATGWLCWGCTEPEPRATTIYLPARVQSREVQS